MSSPGVGAGGNINQPPTLLPNELEASAWTQVNKAALGINFDSIEQALTMLSPRYVFGYMGGFGYRATANNPLLDHKLENVRASTSQYTPTDESNTQYYEELLSLLPQEIQDAFKEQKLLPFDQRNPNFVAVDNLFNISSKFLASLYTLGKPEDPNAAVSEQTYINMLFPFVSLQGGVRLADEVVMQAKAFLGDQGPNYLYFDAFNRVLGDFEQGLLLLNQLNLGLGDTEGTQLTEAMKQDAANAAVIFSKIADNLTEVNLGNDLQIILPMARTLMTIAQALSLPNTGHAALYIGLTIALMNGDIPGGNPDLMGPELSSLLQELSQGVSNAFIPAANPATQKLLSMLYQTMTLTTLTYAALSVDPGYGRIPDGSIADSKEFRLFGYELALGLLVGSGFLENIYSQTIASVSGRDNISPAAGNALALATTLLLVFATAADQQQPVEDQLYYLSSYFTKNLSDVESMSQANDSPGAQAINIAAKQMLNAIDQTDGTQAFAALAELFENYHTTPEEIFREIQTVMGDVRFLAATILEKGDDQPLTGIVGVA